MTNFWLKPNTILREKSLHCEARMWVQRDRLTEGLNVPEQHKQSEIPFRRKERGEKYYVLGKGILKLEKLGKLLNI